MESKQTPYVAVLSLPIVLRANASKKYAPQSTTGKECGALDVSWTPIT